MSPADVAIGPSPSELSQEAAFRIFPIAHQYDLQTVVMWCSQAVGKTKLELWPSHPIASSGVSKHPGFVQWLALADAKRSNAMVDSCLSQLTASRASSGVSIIREALVSPHLRPLMDGLRPETMIKAMSQMAGLPSSFKVNDFDVS